jgi:hypothetical protein
MTDERFKTAFAKAFLVFAVIVTAAALAFSVYLGGQAKTLDKLASALERGDLDMFSGCFADTAPDEYAFDLLRAGVKERLNTDGDFRVKYEIKGREYHSFNTYVVRAKATVYAGDVFEEWFQDFYVCLKKGKWYLL